MFRTALATHAFIAGLIVLASMTPSALVAQLPDAPSAVILERVESPSPSTLPALRRAESAGWGPHLRSEPAGNFWRLPFGPAGNSVAMREEAVAVPQQRLPKPEKQNAGSNISSSISETRPVPGAAPVLRNICPYQSCSQAETILCCGAASSPFTRYLKNPDTVPLNARDNLNSAVRHVIDPFNLMTIVADAAIGVASDSHTVYGPGFDGFSKYAGVSLTEDMTGEFFGTFLIPSLVRQDPHYHREPFLPVKRRVLHAITQVVWAQSYSGRPMFNYANIVGGIATAVVSNTFVPGANRQGFSNTAQRLAIAFAISPSGNLITEFVPDFARRINLRVVIFQRILNSVTLEESGVQ